MIEIIAIYLASKNIAEIAQEKGYSKGLWRFLAILAWIVFEIIGGVIGIIIFGQNGGLMVYILALAGAFLGIFIVRKLIDNKPNNPEISNDLLDT